MDEQDFESNFVFPVPYPNQGPEWESTIKKRMSSWVIPPSQRIISFNSRPYFMTFMLLIELWFHYRTIADNVWFGENLIGWIASLLTIASSILAYVSIGIPLEIAHGTLRISVLYLLSQIYTQIVAKVIIDYFRLFIINTTVCALAGVYAAIIARNWKEFPYKYQRIVMIFVMVIPIEAYINLQYDTWRFTMIDRTCECAGILFGLLVGYYWISIRHEANKSETRWKNYAIVISILTAYLIVMEISGIHITAEEWMREHVKTSSQPKVQLK